MFKTDADAALSYTLALARRQHAQAEIFRIDYLLSLAKTELGRAEAAIRIAELALRETRDHV